MKLPGYKIYFMAWILGGIVLLLSRGCWSKEEEQCPFQELREEQSFSELQYSLSNSLSAVLRPAHFRNYAISVTDSLKIEHFIDQINSRTTKYPSDSLFNYNKKIGGLCNCFQNKKNNNTPSLDSVCQVAFAQYLCYLGLATCSEGSTLRPDTTKTPEDDQSQRPSESKSQTHSISTNVIGKGEKPKALFYGLASWEDGTPIKGLLISIFVGGKKYLKTTNAEGTFSGPELSIGDTIQLDWHIEEKNMSSEQTIIFSSSPFEIDIPFPEYSLSGHVDDTHGNGIKGVLVSTNIDGRQYDCQSNDSGKFLLVLKTRPRTHTIIHFEKPGFKRKNIDFIFRSYADFDVILENTQ